MKKKIELCKILLWAVEKNKDESVKIDIALRNSNELLTDALSKLSKKDFKQFADETGYGINE
jgi:hypothetical protein